MYPKDIPVTPSKIPVEIDCHVRSECKGKIQAESLSYSALARQLLLNSVPQNSPPLPTGSFLSGLELPKRYPWRAALKISSKSQSGKKIEKKKRRARLKYQCRIYALDLGFNNATENQYLIKQMMEKNTAREMRLLQSFQKLQSRRRWHWQNGLVLR